MALTEEQLKELALRVDAQLCSEGHVATSAAYAIAFAANLIAALPKPDAVAEFGDEFMIHLSKNYKFDQWPKGELLYTEAPIAQPASAPTGWDAEFLAKRLGRVAKLAGVSIPERFTHEQVAEAAGTILGQIAAAMEAKAASAPSEQNPVACCACEDNPSGENIPCFVCGKDAPKTDYKEQLDAERWRYARRYLSIEDIELWQTEMKGHQSSEEENVKADSTIDAAIASVKGGE